MGNKKDKKRFKNQPSPKGFPMSSGQPIATATMPQQPGAAAVSPTAPPQVVSPPPSPTVVAQAPAAASPAAGLTSADWLKLVATPVLSALLAIAGAFVAMQISVGRLQENLNSFKDELAKKADATLIENAINR